MNYDQSLYQGSQSYIERCDRESRLQLESKLEALEEEFSLGIIELATYEELKTELENDIKNL